MHIKRLIMPKFWANNRKDKAWAIVPSPGPHKKFGGMPLGILLRDLLKLCSNTKEVKKVLNDNLVKVDGRIRKNKNYGVGLMDAVQIGDVCYRVVPNRTGFEMIEIPAKEAGLKLVKVMKKVMVGKKIQVNLHDGKNILSNDKKIQVGDSLLLSLPDLKIQKHLPLKKDVDVMIILGRHSGVIAKYKDRKRLAFNPDAAILEKGKESFETKLDYLMVVGEVKVSK